MSVRRDTSADAGNSPCSLYHLIKEALCKFSNISDLRATIMSLASLLRSSQMQLLAQQLEEKCSDISSKQELVVSCCG